MLPSIDLNATDFTALNADSNATEGSRRDRDASESGFASLLQQPSPAGEPDVVADPGEPLPPAGNSLPPDGITTLLVADQFSDESGDENPLLPDTQLPDTRPIVIGAVVPGPVVPALEPGPTPAPAATPLRVPVDMRLSAPLPETAALKSQPDTERKLGPAQTRLPIVETGLPEAEIEQQQRGDTFRVASAAMRLNREELFGKEGLPGPAQNFTQHDRPTSNGPAPIAMPKLAGTPEAAFMARPATGRAVPGESSVSATTAPADILAALTERSQGRPGTADLSTTTSLTVAAGTPLVNSNNPLSVPGPAPVVAAPPSPIGIPLQDPAWADALGERVLFMTGQKLHRAEIRLHPAELGPVTIRVSVDDGAADVKFTAQHPLARDAIEHALPRLRELLSTNGLSLANTSVADQGVQYDRGGTGTPEPQQHSSTEAGELLPEDRVERSTSTRTVEGEVDTFV